MAAGNRCALFRFLHAPSLTCELVREFNTECCGGGSGRVDRGRVDRGRVIDSGRRMGRKVVCYTVTSVRDG